MRDYGEVAALTENDLSSIRTLADDTPRVNFAWISGARLGAVVQ